jgi:two-component system sensor histidine kinase YesM
MMHGNGGSNFNFIKNFNWFSIKTKLIICFLILSLLPIIIFVFSSYQSFVQNINDNAIVYTFEVIEQINKSIETYISDIENILQMRNDYYVLQYLKLNEANDIDGNRKYTVRLWETFNSLKEMKTGLDDIRLVSHTGQTCSCYGIYWTDITRDPLYQELRTSGSANHAVQLPHLNIMGQNVFTIARNIDAPTLKGKAIICLDVDLQFLQQLCSSSKLGKKGYIFLADPQGRIVYDSTHSVLSPDLLRSMRSRKILQQQRGNFAIKLHGKELIVTFSTSKLTGWKIIGVSVKEELTRNLQRIQKISFLVLLSILFIIIFLTIYLSNLLTNPIQELQRVMKRVSENDLSTQVRIHTRDELGKLGESFNRMTNRIQELMENIVADQIKIRKLEMKAFQEMIKPHFVYNTMDSIIALLEQKRDKDAMNLLEQLGRFFRITLSHGKEVVSIQEEMEHIRIYLQIQQFRFANKYNFIIELDEQLYQYQTIKLLLQPLVENAIYHGIRKLKNKNGIIIIKGSLTAEQICFEIIDNGMGINPAEVEYMNTILQEELIPGDEELYFGIRNVNTRIKLNFGKQFGLKFESKLNVGTRAIVNIPIIPKKAGDVDV